MAGDEAKENLSTNTESREKVDNNKELNEQLLKIKEDVDKVKNALQQVVDETPQVLKDQPIFVGITGYGASAIDYTIRVWVNNSEYWDAYLPMLERVKRVFEKENIEIPYNQVDVHLINQ